MEILATEKNKAKSSVTFTQKKVLFVDEVNPYYVLFVVCFFISFFS